MFSNHPAKAKGVTISAIGAATLIVGLSSATITILNNEWIYLIFFVYLSQQPLSNK
jgi:hypothetical protein